MKATIATAEIVPAVMPFPSSTPTKPSPITSGKIHWFWNPTPSQNETPTTAAFR